MRFLLALSGFLFFSIGVVCQNIAPPTRIASAEDIISHAIAFGAFEGNMQKQIARMGDAASVSVTRVLAEREPSGNDIDIVLVILRSSFADPNGVETVTDREPRTTLFVLRSLNGYTSDADLKKRIADTRTYIQEQFRKYKVSTQSEAGSRP